MMKLRVLMDNNTYIDEYYLGEPGVSYYIELDDMKILFDAGYTDAFLKNAELMDIDLSRLTHVVLSHGHDDHTRGLKFLCDAVDTSGMEMIAHPLCFYPKWDDTLAFGSPFSRKEMEARFRCRLSAEPLFLAENLCFLGEIPVAHDFEQRRILGKTVDHTGDSIPDYVYEDSALTYRTEEGLAIITGCSHSGICNIITHAQNVMGDERIAAIIGGFHLLKVDERLEGAIGFLNQLWEKYKFRFYPCHCVSLAAKMEMGKTLPVEEVGVGLELTF